MKPDSNTVIWFKRVVLLSALLAICVVGLGAYVRLSDAGLGCPDWPGCYGYMSVPESEAAIAQAQAFFLRLRFEFDADALQQRPDRKRLEVRRDSTRIQLGNVE